MFSNSMRTYATTTAAAARLSFPILIRQRQRQQQQQQQPTFVNHRHHLFSSSSSAFTLRLRKVSRLTARVFSSFQVAMETLLTPAWTPSSDASCLKTSNSFFLLLPILPILFCFIYDLSFFFICYC